MLVKHEKPPIWDEASKAFNLAGHKPIFAWGNTIYRPFGGDDDLPEFLIAHERIHGLRQLMYLKNEMPPHHWSQETAVRLWWQRYITDAQFRFDEEIPAHRAELGVLYLQEPARAARRRNLTITADRLCSSLYNWPTGLINREKAKKILKETF